MDLQYEPIRQLLARVRARHRAIAICRAIVRAALLASAIVGGALAAASVASIAVRSPLALASVAAAALLLAVAAWVWAFLPLRERPSDVRVARFVEERVPSLDDRLATAVDVVSSGRYESMRLLAEPLVKDAARRAGSVDLDAVVASAQVRRHGVQAAAAAIVLLVLLFMARGPARQSLDAASLALFPARTTLVVTPGDTRVKEGAPVAIEAKLAGNTAPVVARLEIDNGPGWRASEMASDSPGRFRARVPAAAADFRYRVVAGTVTSPIYRVSVSAPPRVARVDVDYTYPPALGLPPRSESDAGDIYAPSDTQVRLRIHTERPVAGGRVTLSAGASTPLVPASPTDLTMTMTVSADGSYRIGLVDRDGLTNDAGTEYFIRVVNDRPPDVHVTKPATDRQVTALEEVDIEAQADDDYGLERVELVYAVRGETEKVVPLAIGNRATSATVKHTLYLEDLGVKPGDFVSYYVRARDVTRSARAGEGRSDIFFLEVRPFEQEFTLAESQSMAGSGYNGSIDDLVAAEKQIVVSTWKIDNRSTKVFALRDPLREGSARLQPSDDVRAISRSQSDLRVRAEEVASSFRESTMRDPRSRLTRGGTAPMAEEIAMAAAVDAMGRAVASLDALKTGAALPAEMQALNALLEAQALVKRRQVSRQQSAQGAGSNNRNYDISALFDKELQRLQETNYESRPAGPQKPADAMAEKLKELARRQDELLRRQQDLQTLPEDERKRELEKLTREQAELREQAEDLAKSSKNASSPNASAQMRDIAKDMQGATNDLRRQDSKSSQSRGRQALDKLQRMTQPGQQQDKKETGPGRLEDALAKARELREKLDALTREIQQPGSSGDRKRLQQDAQRQLQQVQELIEQLRRDEPSLATGGPGFTFEGQGMTFSAPGTESFKQDVSRWQELRDQATRALDRVSAAVTKKLDEQGRRDRLAAGVDDKAPAGYRSRVDEYFKAIAVKKPQ
jgi:hypothetical protein